LAGELLEQALLQQCVDAATVVLGLRRILLQDGLQLALVSALVTMSSLTMNTTRSSGISCSPWGKTP